MFEGKHIVRLLLANLAGDGPLATSSVDGDNRTLDGQKFQQGWNCRDFVRFCIDRHLSKGDMVFAAPSADQVQRIQPFSPIKRPPQGFAVDGDDLAAGRVVQCRGPTHKAFLKLGRINHGPHPCKRVVRRNAVRQFQKVAQPRLLVPPIFGDLKERLASGDDRTHRYHQNIHQLMQDVRADPRVLQVREILDNADPVPVRVLRRHPCPFLRECLGLSEEWITTKTIS